MSFVSTDPASRKGKSDIWLTPLWIINALGEFDYDPCGELYHKTAKHINDKFGLERQWVGKVWLNPPYSEAGKWLDKLAKHNLGTALLFNRMDTKSLQKHVQIASSVFFLEGRIKFLKPNLTEGHNAGCGSMLLSYGYTPCYSKLKGWKAK
jgi:hypothetical protein